MHYLICYFIKLIVFNNSNNSIVIMIIIIIINNSQHYIFIEPAVSTKYIRPSGLRCWGSDGLELTTGQSP